MRSPHHLERLELAICELGLTAAQADFARKLDATMEDRSVFWRADADVDNPCDIHWCANGLGPTVIIRMEVYPQ